MHHSSHPFRLVGQLSRNAYNYWKNVSSKRPFVRRVRSALFWLPTVTVFTQVGCTIRAVTGNSMQVRVHPIPPSATSGEGEGNETIPNSQLALPHAHFIYSLPSMFAFR